MFPLKQMADITIVKMRLKKKKLAGLLFITLFINTLNLILPFFGSLLLNIYHFISFYNVSTEEIIAQSHNITFEINFGIECLIFITSFYFIFCSSFYQSKENVFKLLAILIFFQVVCVIII